MLYEVITQRFRQGEGRKGYLLSTAATRGAKIFDCSILTARYIYDAMDVEYGGELLVKGVDERKAVLKAPDEMARAEKFVITSYSIHYTKLYEAIWTKFLS